MKIEKFNYRKANLNDSLVIYNYICSLEEFRFDLTIFENIFKINIQNENVLYYVAEIEDGSVVGFISCHIQILLHHAGKVAEIQELFVESKYRNSGIGSGLINIIEIMTKNIKCVSLEVTAQNKRNKTHDFYKSKFFTQSHLKFTKKI
jgi:PhnO protein